ncbi:MAG: YaaR family protein [Defluviitaleaceae bacterium]|nr:YaaR family protein [Defluviitaleaceae bacterium]
MELKISDILAARFAEAQQVTDKPRHADFIFTLNKLSDEGLSARLEGLINEIGARGKRLAEHMDIADMRHYRRLVSNFLNEVVTHSHEFSRENFLDRRGRHRVLSIVRLVNKDLDDLAQELLKKEKDHLEILSRTEDILGLLLDLFI